MILALALTLSLHARAADLPLVIQGVSQKIAALDPYTLTGIDEYTVTGHVIEPLARMDSFSKKLVPVLAESWTVKGPLIQLRLRKDAIFHNGQPFTADDVKFTYDSYFEPQFHGEIWQGVFRKIKELKVTGKYSVEIALKSPDLETYINVLTSMRILPRSAYEKSDKRWRDAHMIGTGPFKIAKFDPSKSLDLEPNEKWWSEPKPEFRLRVKTVGDFHLAEMMAQKQELDFYEVPSDESMATKNPNVKPLIAARGTSISIGLNLKRPIFNDLKIRKALVEIWNRKALNEKLYGGKWEIAKDAFSPSMEFYPKEGEILPFDPLKAVKALNDTGWRDSDRDSVLDKNGRKFEFTLAVHDTGSERWASLYQADAAKVGIKVNLQRIDEDVQWWKLLKEGKFDAVADSGGATDEVTFSTWHSKGEYNFYGFSTPALDKMIERFLREGFNPEKYQADQKKMIAYIRPNYPQLPGLFSRHALFLISPRLEVDEKFPTQAWRWRTKL
jgi:peptide/nickel transport system substrate-binding protein